MIKAHRNALRKSRIALIQDLQAHNILNHMVQCELLTDREYDEVKAARTNQEKNELILGYLPRKGMTAFDKFIAVLKEVPGQQHLATKLLQAAQLDRSSSLPASPSSADGKLLFLNRSASHSRSQHHVQPGVTASGQPVVQPAEDIPEKYTATFTSSADADLVTRSGRMLGTHMEPTPSPSSAASLSDLDRVYPMAHQPCGLALIINNKNFHHRSGMKDRTGTDVDARALERLWTKLGFTSKIFNNVSGEDMRRQMRALALHDHSSYDCVIVSLLTHGIEGRLYGADGELVSVEELIALFNANRAHRSLIGKPKLFFIQACRGEIFDKGVDQDLTDFCGQDETDAKLASLPAQADMLIAYATTPGYVSWRNSERGSWFIQGITRVFEENADREDVTSMMVLVNQVVATEFEASKHSKQVPSPIVRLTKKLYFRPAYKRK